MEAKASTNGHRASAQAERRGPRLKRDPDMEKVVAIFTLAAAALGTAISAFINSAA
jgi:hypothetical protein